MAESKRYTDPTGRAVAVFKNLAAAESARGALVEFGFADEAVHLLHGESDAQEVDDSAKWFADTDEEIHEYRADLEAGRALISVPADSRKHAAEIHDVFAGANAVRMTYFGRWVTESVNIEQE